VNASVALKWHLTHEPFALQALDLLNDWRKGDLDLLAPDIFFAEISHALVRAIRRGRLSPDEAKIVLSDLLAVAVQMFPTRLLVQRAMEIAL
jgi:predicted nucleic acid-binding protein